MSPVTAISNAVSDCNAQAESALKSPNSISEVAENPENSAITTAIVSDPENASPALSVKNTVAAIDFAYNLIYGSVAFV